jgi:hypothetical protein
MIEKRSKKLTGRIIAEDLKVTGLPASTVQYILAGYGRDLPRWRIVAEFVVVLRDLAKDEGVDPDRLGTVEQWKAKHEAAAAAIGVAAAITRAPAEKTSPFMQTPLGQDGTTGASVDGVISSDSIHHEVVELLCRLSPDMEAKDRLSALAQETTTLDWWREYEDVVPRWFRIYLSLEPAANLIRTYDTYRIPSLLQTSAYAEATIRQIHPDMLPSQIQRHHALRARRQQILRSPRLIRLWTIIDETALRPSISTDVMREQLTHLINLCNRPDISVQVMPTGPDNHAVGGGPISLLRFPQREFSDVAYLEHLTRGLYSHTLDDLKHYDKVLSCLAIAARQPADSVEILHRIRSEL